MKKILFIFALFVCILSACESNEKVISSISVASDIKDIYHIEDFDLTDLKLNVFYLDNTLEIINISEDMLVKNDLNLLSTEGNHTLILTYKGFETVLKLNLSYKHDIHTTLKSIYNLALTSNLIDMSYDEWLNSIKGSDGISITSTSLDKDGNLVITFSDGSVSNLGSVIQTYTVNFYDASDNIISTQKVLPGMIPSKVDEPTKEAHHFIGWDKDLTQINSNLDVKPLFNSNETYYKVSYENNDHVKMSDRYVKYGTYILLDTPTNYNSSYWGWSYKGEFLMIIQVTTDIYLELVEREDIYKAVFYMDNSKSNIYTEQHVEAGSPFIEPTTPTKDGFIFNGWKVDNKKVEFPYLSKNYQTTFIATWKSVTQIPIAIISANANVLYSSVEQYATENKVPFNYYFPMERNENTYIETIDEAVLNGAQIVIINNISMGSIVYKMQQLFPDVRFIMFNSEPFDENYNEVYTENTTSFYFNQEDAAFLAGYAAVKEGLTEFGFIYENSTEFLEENLIGLIAGIHTAAFELGKEIYLNPSYFSPIYNYWNDTANLTANNYYSIGTELIFFGDTYMTNELGEVADIADKFVINLNNSNAFYPSSHLTIISKDLNHIIYEILTKHFSNNFYEGNKVYYGITSQAVTLDFEKSNFTYFSKADYDLIYSRLLNGNIVIPQTVDELTNYLHDLGITELDILTIL